MSDDLWRKSATALARMIKSREVSSTEAVRAHLERIEAVNPALNAVVLVLADQALEAAATADRRVTADGDELGPLHGVPVTIKENVDVAGTATTNGLPVLKDAVASADAPVVERLRAAGAIVIGRTNLPDMGLRISTDSSLRGLTRNPWHPEKTAGGSSGGEAAALAAGMTPLGVGNDIGGSLRNPAHCCGISSIKPTTGRVPHATVIAPEDGPLSFQLMAVNGPMARHVQDVRAGLEIMSGPDRRDPASVPAPLHYPDGGGPTRVAIVPEPPGGSTHPAITETVRRAGAHLAAAGYEVDEVAPPEYDAVLDVWRKFLMTDLRALRPLLEQVLGPDAKQFLYTVLESEEPLDVVSYVQLFVRRRQLIRTWAEFLETYPVIVSPIWSQPAFPHGWDSETEAQAMATLELMRPVMPANVLGLPSAATPGGVVDGMPVGVQCMAAAFREDRALDAAAAIERAVGVLTPVDPFVNDA